MENIQTKICFLSGNALKFIAALSMLADHIGMIFFPNIQIFRIIGRLAFPIFAFMIAEGCRYTKNKARYFFTVFVLGIICQTAYFLYNGDTYMNVLITFSLSIIAVYSLQNFKNTVFSENRTVIKCIASALVLFTTVLAILILNIIFEIDYGFFGCMLAFLISLFNMPEGAPENLKKLDTLPCRLLMLLIGLALIALGSGKNQPFALMSLPILLCYSGKRARLKTKYFFYIFYPLHLALLQGIAIIIELM